VISRHSERAAGSRRAAIGGLSEGGPLAILFSATYPERVSALALCGTFACGILDAEDNPGGLRWVRESAVIEEAIRAWGTGRTMSLLAPSADGVLLRQGLASFERSAASPRMAQATKRCPKPVGTAQLSALATVSADTQLNLSKGGRCMSTLLCRTAVIATTAALACGGAAAPVAAHGNKGHHGNWTTKQCENQAKRWKKAHKHPTAKQTKQENKLLAKHSCTNTV
jgi:pimeloyl-ACP methyl ester carboxylesterase